MEVLTNLYPLEVNLKEGEFTVFSPHFSPETDFVNRTRYRLGSSYRRPTIFRDGTFWVQGRVEEEAREVKISPTEKVLLRREGVKRLVSFLSERELGDFVRDVLRFSDFKKERLVGRMEGRTFGDLLIYLVVQENVLRRDKRFLLQVDFKFNLLLEKSVQNLIEEGKLKAEDVRWYRLKPVGIRSPGEVSEIRRLRDLGKEFVKGMADISESPITKEAWRKLLKDEDAYQREFVIILEGRYTYPASLLKIAISPETIEEGIYRKLDKVIKPEPAERLRIIRKIVREIGEILSEKGIKVNDKEEAADGRISYNNVVVDGEGRSFRVKNNTLQFIRNLTPFVTKEKVKVFVLFVEKEKPNEELKGQRKRFMTELRDFLRDKGITLESSGSERVRGKTRSEVLMKLSSLIPKIGEPDIVLAFLDQYEKADPYEEEVYIYDYLKSKLLERMINLQVVLNETLLKDYADENSGGYVLLNVAVQFMAKTGNMPYKIKGGIEGADYFVGIDVSRIKRGSSAKNMGAFTEIFAKDGSFLRYKILSEVAYGERLTRRSLQELFLSLREVGVKEGSRIVFHRDGKFQGDEVENFIYLSEEFGYRAELVEVVKTGNPRMFGDNLKGCYYKLGEDTIVLATYNRVPRGTHKPLRLRRVYGELPIETVASQVLSLTLMNFSSFQPSKLPTTTRYSDRIAKLLLRGVEPSSKEDKIMYWL